MAVKTYYVNRYNIIVFIYDHHGILSWQSNMKSKVSLTRKGTNHRIGQLRSRTESNFAKKIN
ncbi:hypothetical protein WN55_07237 [Dufourea novaeangliae]|uniref:Uncharacterized protein n=1 Tax=Dufourea novaeangliae TaxID=178035 RepID=A0A154PT99_DUFNO|nr:hypothetical protein WN55_07237 [Dufourea novaeangliae]